MLRVCVCLGLEWNANVYVLAHFKRLVGWQQAAGRPQAAPAARQTREYCRRQRLH